MEDWREKLGKAFLEEAFELLAELENALMVLEESPEDAELVARVFRALHTIKGNSSIFGYENVGAFTHQVESVYDLVRNGMLPVSKQLVDLTLAARDQIMAILKEGEAAADDPVRDRIVASLRELVAAEQVAPTPPPPPPAAPAPCAPAPGTEAPLPPSGGTRLFRIRFAPDPDLFAAGVNPLLLLRELSGLGDCRVTVRTDQVPPLEEMDPELCYLAWDILLSTTRDANAVREVFLFVQDRSRLSIQEIQGEELEEEREERLGDLLVERGEIGRGELEEMVSGRPRLGEELVAREMVPWGAVESALTEQQVLRDLREKRQSEDAAASIRVPSRKLDELVNLVGELVTLQARLSQVASLRNDPELTAVAESAERLIWDLRDSTFNVRMVPIGTTFNRFRRIVRDLAQETGKEVNFVTEGAETELDKTVIEKLGDPLVHLIRNCIDHGLETPAARLAAGKPWQGTIVLAAAQSGARVLIEVRDDGGGVDHEAVRRKAVERSLLLPEDAPSPAELLSLLFRPGFSTASAVTSLSGRGVGLDVVKRSVDDLRGTVEVESHLGRGTVFTIALPLTLAIIDGLQVVAGGERFILPLAQVEECVELTRRMVAEFHGRRLLLVRNRTIPYVRLRERFGLPGEVPAIEQVVILKHDARSVGLAVDYVAGEHQTVIKNLGRLYRQAEGVSGATILGDGTIAIILDTAHIIRAAEREETGGEN
jgi:two-component system chemotaxis sensor kinase CheA